MAYIRYKEVTKTFNFSKSLSVDEIPSYGKDYVYEDETLLAGYVVGKDIGIITDKKVILFDNFGGKKEVTTIPYHAVLAHSIIFHTNTAEIYFLLTSSNPLLLKFSNMTDRDKMKLRYLYNAMSALICGQKVPKNVEAKLVKDDFDFE